MTVPASLPIAFIDQVALWGTLYVPSLLTRFGLNGKEVATLLKTPHVREQLRERTEYWARAASPEERIKAKARMSVEDAIPEMQRWLDDPELHMSSKLAIIQELVKLAALPRPQEQAVVGGAALVLNIDLREDKRVTVDTNPVIEAGKYAIVSGK